MKMLFLFWFGLVWSLLLSINSLLFYTCTSIDCKYRLVHINALLIFLVFVVFPYNTRSDTVSFIGNCFGGSFMIDSIITEIIWEFVVLSSDFLDRTQSLMLTLPCLLISVSISNNKSSQQLFAFIFFWNIIRQEEDNFSNDI